MNIISIMPVWDEQNIIALSLYSTKDFVSEYIIINQKGTDKTKEVIEYCKNLWNLKITYLESDLKLRYKRELIMKHAQSYADYYIIQDGDEVYRENSKEEIYDLIKNNYTFASAPIVLLENSLNHTTINDSNIIMPNHPFFFKNIEDIYFPEVGDMPWYDPNKDYHKVKHYKEPLKFDCKIKNFRRKFLRDMFTEWHDSNSELNLEEYCNLHHYSVKWCRKNINKKLSLHEVIDIMEKDNNTNIFKWNKIYEEEKYYERPKIIKYFLEINKFFGIECLEDMKVLENIENNKVKKIKEINISIL